MKIVSRMLLLIGLWTSSSHADVFVGYEFGEMAFNEFKHFAGEVGVSLEGNKAVRFVYMNVALSERHLSSNEARAVDGDNVEGLWRGFEIFYDMPITKRLSLGVSAGRYENFYRHTVTSESLRVRTNTVGFAFSYLGDEIFGINSLYWRFSIPVRYSFNPIRQTQLEDTVVRDSKIEYNPWIFIGYRFR